MENATTLKVSKITFWNFNAQVLRIIPGFYVRQIFFIRLIVPVIPVRKEIQGRVAIFCDISMIYRWKQTEVTFMSQMPKMLSFWDIACWKPNTFNRISLALWSKLRSASLTPPTHNWKVKFVIKLLHTRTSANWHELGLTHAN